MTSEELERRLAGRVVKTGAAIFSTLTASEATSIAAEAISALRAAEQRLRELEVEAGRYAEARRLIVAHLSRFYRVLEQDIDSAIDAAIREQEKDNG